MTTRKNSGKRSYTILHWQILGSCQIIIKVFFFLVRQLSKGFQVSEECVCPLPSCSLAAQYTDVACLPPFIISPTFIVNVVNLDQDQNAMYDDHHIQSIYRKTRKFFFLLFKNYYQISLSINSIQYSYQYPSTSTSIWIFDFFTWWQTRNEKNEMVFKSYNASLASWLYKAPDWG